MSMSFIQVKEGHFNVCTSILFLQFTSGFMLKFLSGPPSSGIDMENK